MILIHAAASHAEVCAPYCHYSSAYVPWGQAPAALTLKYAAPAELRNSETFLPLPLAKSWSFLSMNNGV